MVTHNMQQATRVADETVFFLLGEIIEHNNTEAMFSMPRIREQRIIYQEGLDDEKII